MVAAKSGTRIWLLSDARLSASDASSAVNPHSAIRMPLACSMTCVSVKRACSRAYAESCRRRSLDEVVAGMLGDAGLVRWPHSEPPEAPTR
jgi:hypothetical protein